MKSQLILLLFKTCVHQLWDYEVVEAFFLTTSTERYLELEFGPHGQHLVLLLDGRRNAIRHSLPLEYQATIEGKLWKGEAKVQYLLL